MYPQQSVCVAAHQAERVSLTARAQLLPAPEECAAAFRVCVCAPEWKSAEHTRAPDVLFIPGQVFILFLFVCDLPHKFRVAQIKATRRSRQTLCACFHVNFHFLRFILPPWLRLRGEAFDRLVRKAVLFNARAINLKYLIRCFGT